MAPEDETPDVLSSLPRTRPQRRSARRAPEAGKAAASKPAPKKATKKPAPARKPAAAKKGTTAKPRVAAAAPRIPAAGFASPPDTQDRPAPSGVELVGTAIQAAGELAQIGAAVGKQAIESALGRLRRG